MKLLCIAASVLAACSAPKAACPVAPSSPTIPPSDDALARWQAVATSKEKAPPAGTTAAAAVPELVAYLGSPDPVRRDHVGYELLAHWIGSGTLADTDVRALARQLRDNLAGPIAGPGSVFLRSFSVLVLAEVVDRDRKTPFLTDDERRGILTVAHDYASRETDLRGYTGPTGWAHAAAHTADLLARLAQLPSFGEPERATILDTVARFVVRRHGEILAYGEDSRLAASVLAAAGAGVSPETIDTWLATLKAPLVERATRQFDPGLFAAKRNVRNLLFTLFVHLSTAKEASPGERVLLEKIRALLVE